MKAILDDIADRILSIFGVDLDFSVDMRESLLSEITPTVYLGARPSQQSVEGLKEVGVTHVVSCLPEDHRPQVAFLGKDFHHRFFGVQDGIHQNIAGTFSPFFDFATVATASDPNAKLFVHCEVGVSRSATLVIAWLMKIEGLNFLDAYRRVRSKRFKILPNIGFASQLQRLEHELQPHSVSNTPSSLAQYLHQVCNAPVEIDALQSALERNSYDAVASLQMIFGGEIPRVVQGVRV